MRYSIVYLFILVCSPLVVLVSTYTVEMNQTTVGALEPEPPLGVVRFQWPYVSYTMIFAVFIVLVALIGVLLHHLHTLSRYLPETCVLIVIGIGLAAIFVYGTSIQYKTLTNQLFMLYLLPPIVLDAAYGLNSRTFAANIGTILLQAVVGTIINFFIVGPALYGLALSGAMGSGLSLTMVQCLMFASFIVAVDPVAVIAIFKDVGVNDTLYYLVFGESLLNDAVTVVLYDMMANFITQTSIPSEQIWMGVAFFLVSSVGGATIGCAIGVLTSIITKYTYILPAAEPIIVLMMAYISYLLGQLLDWSSIIAITTCGIVQSQWAFPNLAFDSEFTIKKMISVIGSTLEAFVFLLLGAEIMTGDHVWNVGFIMWTIVVILVARAVSIFGLTTFANIFGRDEKISLKHQFVMWYGGLRGALCFMLCATLPALFEQRDLFVTTTIIVILFTVFIQGTTMRPVVHLCNVKMKTIDDTPLINSIQLMVEDHFLGGIEIITGQRGPNYRREQAYIIADKSKEILSRYHSTYMSSLIEAIETDDLSDIVHIRDEQPSEPWHCCIVCHKKCCSKNKNEIGVSEKTENEAGERVTVENYEVQADMNQAQQTASESGASTLPITIQLNEVAATNVKDVNNNRIEKSSEYAIESEINNDTT